MAEVRLRETAPAKINLALHVRERLADGYHRIETLFAFARDGDFLTAEPADKLRLTISGPFGDDLPNDESNLVLRAAARLRAAFAIDVGAALHLEKMLPIASGIGGGSADAAAAMRLLTQLWDIDAEDPRFAETAAVLGADVPACMLSETCFGEGIGEQLRPISAPALSGAPLLLVNPGVAVPTAPVFQAWDGIDRGALRVADPMQLDSGWRNDLQKPAIAIAPQIGDVLVSLAGAQGVVLAAMSGSGATCFAIFEDDHKRDSAASDLESQHRDWWILPTVLR